MRSAATAQVRIGVALQAAPPALTRGVKVHTKLRGDADSEPRWNGADDRSAAAATLTNTVSKQRLRLPRLTTIRAHTLNSFGGYDHHRLANWSTALDAALEPRGPRTARSQHPSPTPAPRPGPGAGRAPRAEKAGLYYRGAQKPWKGASPAMRFFITASNKNKKNGHKG